MTGLCEPMGPKKRSVPEVAAVVAASRDDTVILRESPDHVAG